MNGTVFLRETLHPKKRRCPERNLEVVPISKERCCELEYCSLDLIWAQMISCIVDTLLQFSRHLLSWLHHKHVERKHLNHFSQTSLRIYLMRRNNQFDPLLPDAYAHAPAWPPVQQFCGVGEGLRCRKKESGPSAEPQPCCEYNTTLELIADHAKACAVKTQATFCRSRVCNTSC